MALILETVVQAAVAASSLKYGTHECDLVADEVLEVECGEEKVLELTVPGGKTWAVSISVSISETVG
jgi:hypothetical protein